MQFWLNNLRNQQENHGSRIFRSNWDDDFFPISEGRNLRLLEKMDHESSGNIFNLRKCDHITLRKFDWEDQDNTKGNLGRGFNHFECSPRKLGKWSQFDLRMFFLKPPTRKPYEKQGLLLRQPKMGVSPRLCSGVTLTYDTWPLEKNLGPWQMGFGWVIGNYVQLPKTNSKRFWEMLVFGGLWLYPFLWHGFHSFVFRGAIHHLKMDNGQSTIWKLTANMTMDNRQSTIFHDSPPEN